MGLLPDIGYPQTGEEVEAGIYACMNCPHTDEKDDAVVRFNKRGRLPKCPVCGVQTYWMQIV